MFVCVREREGERERLGCAGNKFRFEKGESSIFVLKETRIIG